MLLKSAMLPPLQAEISVAAGLSPHPASADQPSPPPHTVAPTSLPTSRPLDTISLSSPSLGTATHPSDPQSATETRATIPDTAVSLDEPMDKDIEPPSPAPSTPSEAVEEIEYSPRRPTQRPGPMRLISEEDTGKASRSDVAEGSSRRGRWDAGGDEEMPSESEPEDSENEFEVISPKQADEALEVADRATVEWEEAMGLSPEELALRREQSKSDRAARAAARAAARGLPDRASTLPVRPSTLPDPPTRLFAPPTFEGLRVWIDPNYKKLNKLSYLMQVSLTPLSSSPSMREHCSYSDLQQRSATLVPHRSDASHIVGVPHSLITQLGPFADEIAKSGAKVVNVTWAWDSIHLGTLKPEQSHLIDLGAMTHLVSRNAHQDVGTASDPSTAMGGPSEPPPPAKTRSAAPKPTPVPITPLSTGKSKGKGKSKANDEMDTETLVEIFTRHQELFAKGKAVPEIARFMEQRVSGAHRLGSRRLVRDLPRLDVAEPPRRVEEKVGPLQRLRPADCPGQASCLTRKDRSQNHARTRPYPPDHLVRSPIAHHSVYRSPTAGESVHDHGTARQDLPRGNERGAAGFDHHHHQ